MSPDFENSTLLIVNYVSELVNIDIIPNYRLRRLNLGCHVSLSDLIDLDLHTIILLFLISCSSNIG